MDDSDSEFNEAEDFDEYNPHPYNGGYNIALTYGQPLPPSDAICYPTSGFSEALEETLPSHGEGEEGPEIGSESPPDPEPLPDSIHLSNDPEPLPDSIHLSNDPEPYPDSFGYWPLFSWGSYGQRDADEQACWRPWEGDADFLFGYLPSYGEKRDESHSYGNLNYAYERHTYEEPLSVWVEPTEQPNYSDAYQEQVYSNYSYDSYTDEQPLSVQAESNGLFWSQEPSYSEIYQEQVYSQPECVYSYEMHHFEQPLSVQVEPIEQTWSQSPSYYEVYQEMVHSPSKHGYDYDTQFYEQPLGAHFKSIEPPWSFYEFCQEEAYPQSKEDDDSFKESDSQIYCPFQKYSDYDE